MTVRDAALAAGKIRLRPIAITTLTTLLGLLPMTGWLDPVMPATLALAGGFDSGMRTMVEGMGLSLEQPSEMSPGIGGSTFSLVRGVSFLVGGGEGAEVRKPLAVTVIVGLTSSTLLTLLVIPTLWAWVNKRRDKTWHPLAARRPEPTCHWLSAATREFLRGLLRSADREQALPRSFSWRRGIFPLEPCQATFEVCGLDPPRVQVEE